MTPNPWPLRVGQKVYWSAWRLEDAGEVSGGLEALSEYSRSLWGIGILTPCRICPEDIGIVEAVDGRVASISWESDGGGEDYDALGGYCSEYGRWFVIPVEVEG